MSKQLDVSSTDGCTGKSSSPKRRVLRYMVVIIVVLLAGFVIVKGPNPFGRELIIRNESSKTITIKKAAYATYNKMANQLVHTELGSDLTLLPNSEIRLPIRAAEIGISKLFLADGRMLGFSMSFGWGQSDICILNDTGAGYSGQESKLRQLVSTAALKLPVLNRLLY